MENAADNFDNGTKSAYNPDAQVCNRTQAIIAAVLVTVDGSQASPIDLAKWAGRDYTEDSVKVDVYKRQDLDYNKHFNFFYFVGDGICYFKSVFCEINKQINPIM